MASRGARDLGDGEEKIEDADEAATNMKRARRIQLVSVAIAAIVTAALTFVDV